MLLEHRTPQLRHGASPVFAILFEMETLWERYVTWLFRKAAPPGVTVTAQHVEPFWLVSGRNARTVRPDLLVLDPAGRPLLVADAKWKVPDNGPSMNDLRQMFTYNELLAAPRALLVYPATADSTALAGKFADCGHHCDTIHLDLFDLTGWSPTAMITQVSERFPRTRSEVTSVGL